MADQLQRHLVRITVAVCWLACAMSALHAQTTVLRNEAERRALNENRVGLATGGIGGRL